MSLPSSSCALQRASLLWPWLSPVKYAACILSDAKSLALAIENQPFTRDQSNVAIHVFTP